MCAGVPGCTRVCTGLSGCTRMYMGVPECARVYTGLSGCMWLCAQVCMGVCMWDEFSKYLLET